RTLGAAMLRPDAAAQVNALLARYYAAREPADAELEAVLAGLRPHLRQRFLVKGATGEDVEDLCGEAIRRLVIALRGSREAGAQRIARGYTYALSLADHLFIDHLRRAKPAWCHLRRCVIDLLDGRGAGDLFARWRVRDDWLGGLARWRGRPFRA